MRHRPYSIFSYWLSGLGKGDTHPAYQGRIYGLKSGGRIMASAKNEMPKAPRGVGCATRGVVWGGAMPRNFFRFFEHNMTSFRAFWELILLQLKSGGHVPFVPRWIRHCCLRSFMKYGNLYFYLLSLLSCSHDSQVPVDHVA